MVHRGDVKVEKIPFYREQGIFLHQDIDEESFYGSKDSTSVKYVSSVL